MGSNRVCMPTTFLLNGLVDLMFMESVERVFEVMLMVKGFFKVGESQKVMEKLRDTEMRSVEPDKI